jgi:hypothetical protein
MLSLVFVLSHPGIEVVNGREYVAPSISRSSVSNQVLDFYAGGTSGSFSLRMSPQGGEMSIDGSDSITWTAWGFVTAQWSIGTVYIFLLANVTNDDFRIGFLYLVNSSYTQFILRVFDYKTANIDIFNFDGVQHIYNRTVLTNPTAMPQLQLLPEAQIKGGFSAIGSGFYLNDDGGEDIYGNNTFTIYPIYHQLFTGPNDYNELWSLMTDSQGNSYFAILYMKNGDRQHIIAEHQLRLNDYRRLVGRTIDATWTIGLFPNRVIVRLPASAKVLVDDVPFQTNSIGALALYLPSTEVTIQVPSEITASNSSKLGFVSWGAYGSSNPLNLLLNSSVDLRPDYRAGYSTNSAIGNSGRQDLNVGQDLPGVFLGTKKIMPFTVSTWN